MTTAAPPQKRKRTKPKYQFGLQSNGILMTPAEFDNADPDDFDQEWSYELINGVLIVSPIPLAQKRDPNEELGRLLRNYKEDHAEGKTLNKTLPEEYVRTGKNRRNRRRADRVIWAGFARRPRLDETPTVIVEFVSRRKRDRDRDYETKRDDYAEIKVQEYWIIDRFQKTMTAHILESGKYRKKVVHAKQTYRTKLLPGFELPLAHLFELADEWDEDEPEEAT